jgi:hypothetical protein
MPKKKLISPQNAIKQFCLFCLNIERKTPSYYSINLIKRLCDATDCPFWPDNRPLKRPVKAIKIKCHQCNPDNSEIEICFQCPIKEWLKFKKKRKR